MVLKKSVEIFLSIVIILIGLPFIVIILTLDFIFTGQFPLILQERKISLDRKAIKILKIRTIIDSNTFRIKEKNSNEILIHSEYANHIPSFCRWLRKSGIDEAIQLLNVLTGEMSLVGPRPLLARELKIMEQEFPGLYKRRKKINSLPGITGYWQVYGNRNLGISNLIEMDEYYEKNKSFLLYMQISLKTFWVMISATHSDSIISKEDKVNNYKINLTD